MKTTKQMSYLLCCRARGSVDDEETEVHEQVVKLLKNDVDLSEDESQDDAEDESKYDKDTSHKSLLVKMGEKEKVMIERISIAEAIVAEELQRIQSKIVHSEEAKRINSSNIALEAAGGARGETEVASGLAVDEPASSEAAVSEKDQISIAPREETTEMEVAQEEPPSSAAASVAETKATAQDSPTTLYSSCENTTSSLPPIPSDSSKGANRQNVTGKEMEGNEIEGLKSTDDAMATTEEKETTADGITVEEHVKNVEVDASHNDEVDRKSAYGRGDMGDAQYHGLRESQIEEKSDLKREFSTSLHSLESTDSTYTLTSGKSEESASFNQIASGSEVEVRSTCSDMDLRCCESSEDDFDHSAKQLAQYLKIRNKNSTASSSDESVKSIVNGDDEDETSPERQRMDLADVEEARLGEMLNMPEIVFPCLKEAPPIPEEKMAEATLIPQQSFIDFVNEVIDVVVDREAKATAGHDQYGGANRTTTEPFD